MRLARRLSASLLTLNLCIFSAPAFYASDIGFPTVRIVPTPVDGGVREDVPKKYLERYKKWKAELLSTEFGRRQWDSFAANTSFVLTIKISDKKGKGARTDKFLWDKDGNFVGATVTLGHEIDEGYPNPIYYPVLNSLTSEQTPYFISGRILAASKLSHELAHVTQTANVNIDLIEKQSKLIPEYTSIFLNNGHNTQDRKLLALAEELGGTPVEIWESREYWSEVAALNFVKERIREEPYYCTVLNKIRSNVQTYARGYVQRFDPDTSLQCGK